MFVGQFEANRLNIWIVVLVPSGVLTPAVCTVGDPVGQYVYFSYFGYQFGSLVDVTPAFRLDDVFGTLFWKRWCAAFRLAARHHDLLAFYGSVLWFGTGRRSRFVRKVQDRLR
eukprot:g76731.t1